MKTFTGTVISLASQKTASVEVETSKIHPLYKKIVRRSKKFPCHLEDIKVNLGDKVLIQECRPVSKTKHFKVIEVIKQKEVRHS
ncbi:MAG: 30S ribosomal protein S17 [Microgenomates bacterium 39_7]|nr:MAG: 30S ribosomal protein S17 [Microgenomates bacterium 39_7]